MMKIVEYINKIFGIENNTTATILISLFTFLFSYILVWLGQLYIAYRERKTIRIVFEEAINKMISQMKNQSKNYSKNSENLVFKNEIGFDFKIGPLFPLNTFENIGYSKLIDIYILRGILFAPMKRAIRKKRAKAINKLWEVITSIHFWNNLAIQNTSKFLDDYNKYNDSRNEAVEGYNQLYLEMYDSLNLGQLTIIEEEYFKKVNLIRDQWIKKTNYIRPDIINEFLIQPLRFLNLNNEQIKYANQMNFWLLKADLEFNNQSNILLFNKNQYLHYSIIYKNYSRLAEKCVMILKRQC